MKAAREKCKEAFLRLSTNFKEEILKEWRKEYIALGHLFFHYKRLGLEDVHGTAMNDEKYVPYYNDGTIHGIILDYADERFKMLVLTTVKMPSSLKTVTGNLARKGLQHFIRNSSARNKTVIKLPKLKLGNQLDLKSLLSSIGLKSFFDPQKGCSCIIQNSPSLYISQARQVVKLSLDETGTEVAAVTIAIPKAECPPPQKVKYNKFYADHPFVLVLFDIQTQAILLTAAIVHPEEK